MHPAKMSNVLAISAVAVERSASAEMATVRDRRGDGFSPAALQKPVQLAIKRVFDIVVAASALAVLMPFFLVIAAAIKFENPGPVLFTQLRWGRGGKKIRVYKFRSMRTDLCDHTGVSQTVSNDPRVTRIGAFLRKTNIDELPQLINILKGDMSLVGPRCHVPGMLAAGRLYEDLVDGYHLRHLVRPGLTGLAQASGFRGPTDREDLARGRIAQDLKYIENFSILMDARILVDTFVKEIRGGTGF
jgi:polysaccharide biosynthesis protein PslA